MKVAILEASHWHFPLYQHALAGMDSMQVSAISDHSGECGPQLAEEFGARFYENWLDLLNAETPDFVFAFGRHCDMHEIASSLIARNIPFAMEKPAGMNAVEVGNLRRMAEQKSLFVSIPLILGYSGLRTTIESLNPGGQDPWQHLNFRFIAGPLDRYLTSHSPWMLNRALAGGGCTINLAVHFIDLIMHLTGTAITDVSARMLRKPDIADVEIYAQLSLTTSKGQLCTIETGYTFPGGTDEPREFSFSLASATHYIRSSESGLRHSVNGQPGKPIALELNTDRHYASFVTSTLADFQSHRHPYAGLDRLEKIMTVIDCAYESDRRGGQPVQVPPAHAVSSANTTTGSD